ncbi:MAG: histidine kinase [Bacteroidetes bacterium]|nr:histidine kinase [Bacteroidota bacterium]
MPKIKYTSFFFFIVFTVVCKSQNTPQPVAKFSFNEKNESDEVNKRKAKLIGVKNTSDRFGNDNYAVFLSGNEESYINLGNYKELKPKTGSISLWINIENRIRSGTGPEYNPIILTKSTALEDFYEAYAIYYFLDTRKLIAVSIEDSIKEVALFYMKPIVHDNWYHIVMAYDDNYSLLYVNGVLEDKHPKKFETRFLSGDSVLVGNTGSKKNQRYFNGTIDDIEFYDKVLSSEEVLRLYESPNPNQNKIILEQCLFIAFILLIIIIILILIRSYIKSTLKKEKQRLELANSLLENELRINRALMNPHFIFNSLNTLNHYILTNNNEIASDYLVKFSKLIRKILDSNMSDTISLEQEIELIHGYLEIEGMRFKEDIKYDLSIDPAIIPSTIIIPIMMVQPFVENSVWHGLRDKKGDKIIRIKFSQIDEKYIECIIDDNGTGRKKKEPNALEKKSLATKFVMQRLELLNKIHNKNCSLFIIDKENGMGTIVKIILPILNK